MGTHRLNHAVRYVRNTERSLTFYREALGFEFGPDARSGLSISCPATV